MAELANYRRPITLLNVDLKIMTAMIASRLAKVMCEASDTDNYYSSITNRYITDNTILLQLMQAFLDNEDLPGYA